MEEKNHVVQRGLVYPGHYWKKVLSSVLLLIFLWGALSSVSQQHLWGALSSASQQQQIRSATVSASGLLQSPVYNLAFRNPLATLNIITEIDVTQGQYVQQGQILARSDPAFFQRTVHADQAILIAAQHHLDATLARQQRAIIESHALIEEAETNFHAAQFTLQATELQAQANIAAAQATLKSDKRVLAAVREQAKAQIQSGDVQAANTAITTAQAQVTKDQAAIAQAFTTARVAVATAQGQVATTRAHILVAAYDPDLLVAVRELAEAQEDFTIAREALRTAQLYLATNTILVAPHAGVVTAINGTVGSLPGIHVNITPKGLGSADTGVVIQLVDLSHVDHLLLTVRETDILKIKIGQHVQFTLKAYADRLFSGTVSAISPNGVTLDTMTYPVIIRIAPDSMKGVTLFPNMTATANIAVD